MFDPGPALAHGNDEGDQETSVNCRRFAVFMVWRLGLTIVRAGRRWSWSQLAAPMPSNGARVLGTNQTPTGELGTMLAVVIVTPVEEAG